MKHIENLEDSKTKKEVEELDIFDFDNIPMSELDKAYIDYEPLYDTVDWFSLDEDRLYEERGNGCLALNHEETPSNIHTEPLCEMANLSQRRTGINTRIYVSSKEGQHGPRIKVYNSSNDESFSMSIEDSPKVLIGNPNIVSTKIFKQIIKWVQINKNILLYYWQHSDMDIDDLLDGIKKI